MVRIDGVESGMIFPPVIGAKGEMPEIISIINHQLDRSRIFGCVGAKKCNIGERGSATALLIFLQ